MGVIPDPVAGIRLPPPAMLEAGPPVARVAWATAPIAAVVAAVVAWLPFVVGSSTDPLAMVGLELTVATLDGAARGWIVGAGVGVVLLAAIGEPWVRRILGQARHVVGHTSGRRWAVPAVYAVLMAIALGSTVNQPASVSALLVGVLAMSIPGVWITQLDGGSQVRALQRIAVALLVAAAAFKPLMVLAAIVSLSVTTAVSLAYDGPLLTGLFWGVASVVGFLAGHLLTVGSVLFLGPGRSRRSGDGAAGPTS